MKTLMVKNGVLLVLTFLVFANLQAEGGKRDYTKEIKKEYSINKNGTIDLSNKNGNITINTWDKNKVKVKVKVMVAAKNAHEADEFFKTIKLNFKGNRDEVSVETTREFNKKWWQWNSWKTNTNFNFSVQYEVNIPKTCKLYATNKFGDIYLEDLYGRANLTCHHGTMKLDHLTGTSKITLVHGRATINEIDDGDLTIRNSTITIKKAKDLKIDSRNSKLNFDRVGDINSNSKNDVYKIEEMNNLRNNGKYDSYEIQLVNSVYATAKYSDFSMGELYGTGEFDVELGDVIIDKLRKSFNKLRVDGKSVNVKVALGSGSTTNVDVYANNTQLDLPKNIKKRINKVEGVIKEIQGRIGGNPKSSIKINSEHGSIIIKR